ncbi:MAG: GNAT family N-acetyltransferase [Armatimonadota bacterium]|nr:GNAT family N-acetyltransferase [Armatimonadota bacterium]
MRIRQYREEDRGRLHQITASSFREASIHGKLEGMYGRLRGTTWAERKCRDIDEDIAAEPEGVLVAETEEGEVVGYITTTTDETCGIGRIPNLAVDPDHQGQGIGTQLINAALDRFDDRGMELAKIETLATNEAGQALYPRFGFQEIVRQIHYIMRMEDAKRL